VPGVDESGDDKAQTGAGDGQGGDGNGGAGGGGDGAQAGSEAEAIEPSSAGVSDTGPSHMLIIPMLILLAVVGGGAGLLAARARGN
jgi:hypothetical protein